VILVLKVIWIEALNLFGKAWWIEISTALPHINYYFGPFANFRDAELSIQRYQEYLKDNKSAQITSSTIKRCKPGELNINCEIEIAENSDSGSQVSLP
jgi:Domain of unknown function (DUF1816)